MSFPFQLYPPKRVLRKIEWALFNRPQIFVECDTLEFVKQLRMGKFYITHPTGVGSSELREITCKAIYIENYNLACKYDYII